MSEENKRIDDPLDINIISEIERRETARMEASFKELVEAGLKAQEEAAAASASSSPEQVLPPSHQPAPAREPGQTRKPVPDPGPAAEGPREITIDEGATPARKAPEVRKAASVKRPDPDDPAVDTVIYDPEAEEQHRSKRAAQHASGRRAQRRYKRALLTENARIIVKDIVIACIIALVISAFIRPTIVQETSMEPTVEPQDYLLMSRQAYRFGELERGDIVIFKSDLKLDAEHNKLLIKRVIGLPGDTLSISGGEVYLNGELLSEPYIAAGGTPGYVEEVTLGAGEVFVMGDHREVSVDSRTFGPIGTDAIVGQAVFRLWPLSGFGTLD